MDKSRELTPEPKPETGRKPLTTKAQELVDEIAAKANLPPEEKTPEPKPKTDRELTPKARQVVDEITEKANLPPEEETPEPPVTK